MLISRSARMMRTAISPRLATRTFSNMAPEAYVLSVVETVDVRVAAPPAPAAHHVAALDELAQAGTHARRRRIAEGIAQLAERQRLAGHAQALDDQPRLDTATAVGHGDLAEPLRLELAYRGRRRWRGLGVRRGELDAPGRRLAP